MIDSSNKILQLPFDESPDSPVAYDYSQSRADGIVNGAKFVPGKNGNAISFAGTDTCEVNASVLDLVSTWSILCWAKSNAADVGSPQQMIWVLNFLGENNFIEIPINITPGSWFSLAVTKFGQTYTFFLNSAIVNTVTNTGTLQGISLNQDYYGGNYGFGCLDDVNFYKVALTQSDIIDELSNIKNQAYYLDGVDLRDYGVYVAGSNGILNRPAMKAPASLSWDNYHGIAVDNRHKYFEQREITLDCFIKANGKNDFINKVVNFERLFDVNGVFNRLVIDVHPIKPLIYIVYCQEAIDVDKSWNDALMVGTFKLKLVEPEPVKRVLKHIRTSSLDATCNITITTAKLINIYWGDGSVDLDVYGTNKVITHTYAQNGDYFPVITGCIDEISAMTTNAIVVWNKL